MFLNRGEGCGGWEVGRGEGSVKTGKRVLGRCLVMVSLGLKIIVLTFHKSITYAVHLMSDDKCMYLW